MAVQTNSPDGASASDDQSQKTQPQRAGGTPLKEQEPTGPDQEKKLLSEIIQTSEAADNRAERQVREAISEARLARPEPAIPPDVSDAGVKSPEQEAEKVVAEGTTIELPVTEGEYQKGLHQKVAGTVVNSVVFGVSGLAGLATWVARIIKIAHKHTVRVIFRRG